MFGADWPAEAVDDMASELPSSSTLTLVIVDDVRSMAGV